MTQPKIAGTPLSKLLKSRVPVFDGGMGTTLYAQADSFNPATDYGTVLEAHEMSGGTYNNIGGPYSSTAVLSSQTLPDSPRQEPTPLGDLPPRP